ncbi:hydantoinase B/oxoprolinase family protein [Rhodospirillum centenum]|uniref:N-methylhydantoinase B (HuyB-1) n=1 Tax=Rhodospirillum centenum (strain ATCC 51521 / SW) TaxID=414684 RepID=B6IXN2_RHOCS|nr:hydantoinase B/oxoprolinase family protein [Rhodospirillum centenum]ACJ01056.1 N-methylhydantoinase B (HuyB-1) [Rhodospirillum centenum SW]
MQPADSFTREVIKNALVAIGDEMFTALKRTSMSPIIYETLDYAIGITDAAGRLIAQGNGVPLFIGTLDAAVRSVQEKFAGPGRISPGDVFITNDPYGGGGTHLSDVTLVRPIFHEGTLLAWAANKAHWTEVGGKDAGSFSPNTTEIYQEGLQFPAVRLFDQGRINEALVDMIRANVRLPDMTLGDMWAGAAALQLGERRFLDLVDKYGTAGVADAVEHLLDHGEAMIRQELARLPKGTFTAEDMIDDDGLGNGPFPVRVAITITDSEFIADFTGSAAQAPGPINNTRAGLLSAVRAVFKALTNPAIPATEGVFRPLKVICPDGTVMTASRPAPVSIYYETMISAADVMWKALAPHMPDRLPAGHYGSVCATVIAGRHPDSGDFFLLVEPLAGGWGAACDGDGQQGQFCVGNGETYNIPVEVTEARYGVRVERFGFHTEDGGAGRFRGGKGLQLEYRVLGDGAFMSTTFGRYRHRPWAMQGGQEGSPNFAEVVRADGEVVRFSKTARLPLARGDLVRLVTGTGGGWGDPRERDPARIAADLRDGYLTPAQAARDYGYDSGH